MKKMQAVTSSLQKEESLLVALFVALGLAFIAFTFLLSPVRAEAAEDTARLGGGNALLRAATGIEHANEESDLVSRLLIVSRHGGKPEVLEVPDDLPSQVPENNGGDGSGSDEDDNGITDGPPVQNPENGGSDENNNENGGASSGNGGHGGNASNGGLVRAGDTVSKAHSINVLNATLVRIGSNI